MWGAASIIYDALHLKTTACLPLPHSPRLSLYPLIPIVTTGPGICESRERDSGPRDASVAASHSDITKRSQLTLNFTYERLWRQMGDFAAADDKHTGVSPAFVVVSDPQVLSVIAAAVTARVKMFSLRCEPHSLPVSLLLKGNSILTCKTLRNQRLQIQTEGKTKLCSEHGGPQKGLRLEQLNALNQWTPRLSSDIWVYNKTEKLETSKLNWTLFDGQWFLTDLSGDPHLKSAKPSGHKSQST